MGLFYCHEGWILQKKLSFPHFPLFPPFLKHCLLFLSLAVPLANAPLSNIWLVFSFAFPAVTLPADTGDCSYNFSPATFTEDFLFARLHIFSFLNPKCFRDKQKVLFSFVVFFSYSTFQTHFQWCETLLRYICSRPRAAPRPRSATHIWPTGKSGGGRQGASEKCLPSFPPHYLSVSFKEQMKKKNKKKKKPASCGS